MRQLACRDAGFDCEAIVQGESDEEVLAQVGPHVQEVHGTDVTPELVDAARAQIRDV